MTTSSLRIRSPVMTEGFDLALEVGRFHYEAEATDGPKLTPGGEVGREQGLEKNCLRWNLQGLPPMTAVEAWVRHGSPPISHRTKLMILLLGAVIIIPIIFGLILARARTSRESSNVGTRSQLNDLDTRLAKGEISIEAYEQERDRLEEQQGVSGLDPQVEARIREILGRGDRNAAQVEEDFAELLSLLRKHVVQELPANSQRDG